jgi:hypothetical protein
VNQRSFLRGMARSAGGLIGISLVSLVYLISENAPIEYIVLCSGTLVAGLIIAIVGFREMKRIQADKEDRG